MEEYKPTPAHMGLIVETGVAEARIETLEAINRDLLEALKATTVDGHYGECLAGKRGYGECSFVCIKILAAIAKAETGRTE